MKVLQFGEGNFLRTFVDVYFDTLNKEGKGPYEVHIAIPIPQGDPAIFAKRGFKYHAILRGAANGKPTEDVYEIDSVKDVFSPFVEPDKYYALARDSELKIIVSNTTEAGIVFHENDSIGDFASMSYPGKLTKFLFERYQSGLGDIYLLPVELIENNADALKKAVESYIELWHLGDDFKMWNEKEVHYCNTLVDRVVSGHPRDEEVKKHCLELIGEDDPLFSVGEPFGLWAIEDKGDIASYIPQGSHNIDVVLTKDIAYYKKRKVRILNGSHTNLVPACLFLGKETVYDCVVDEKTRSFIDATLEEIIPFVSSDEKKTREYAGTVIDRFLNPYLGHQLTSIALNSISKWVARDLPTFKDYYASKGHIPAHMTIGFSYLVALYHSSKIEDGHCYVDLPTRRIELHDEEKYMTYFHDGKGISDFMKDASIWGMDLTKFRGFENSVIKNVAAIERGESLI